MIEDRPWERFLSFSDVASATTAAAYLEQNGVPSRVEAESPGVDFSRAAYVLVPGQLAHRARWLWAQQTSITDAELEFLALGAFEDEGNAK